MQVALVPFPARELPQEPAATPVPSAGVSDKGAATGDEVPQNATAGDGGGGEIEADWDYAQEELMAKTGIDLKVYGWIYLCDMTSNRLYDVSSG